MDYVLDNLRPPREKESGKVISGLSPRQGNTDLPQSTATRGTRLTRFLLSLPLLVALVGTAQGAPLDRVVAVVGASVISDKEVEPAVITQSEVDAVVRPILSQLSRKGSEVNPERIRKKALEELIMRRLRHQEAERLKIKVTDQEIKAFFNQMAQKNNLTPENFAKAINQQGVAIEQYVDELRDQILQSRIISKVINPMVSVSQEEIKELYALAGPKGREEEIHVGQILLAIEPNIKPDKLQSLRNLAIKLVQELKGGANLASLASQYSDDASGLKGGDLGWFKRGQLVPEVEKVVFSQKAGGVVGPVVTPQGILILQVMERRSGETATGDSQQIKVRHILLKLPRKATPEEEAQVLRQTEKIRQELLAGASFEEMAKKHSQDSSKKEGGELGWVGRGLMVREFEDAAFALKTGEISQPVRTAFGWHLVKVDSRRTQDSSSLSAMHVELEGRVRASKAQTKFQQWLRDLRLRAYVEYR